MRKGGKIAAAIAGCATALLGVSGTASATHNLTVVGGPDKFNFALLILMAAPYLIAATFGVVIWRKYRRQE